MLGRARLQGVRKVSVDKSRTHSKRCAFTISAVLKSGSSEKTSERGDKRHAYDLVAAGMSAIVAQLLSANMVWADASSDEALAALQVAKSQVEAIVQTAASEPPTDLLVTVSPAPELEAEVSDPTASSIAAVAADVDAIAAEPIEVVAANIATSSTATEEAPAPSFLEISASAPDQAAAAPVEAVAEVVEEAVMAVDTTVAVVEETIVSAVVAVDLPAEPAVASPVVAMDIPAMPAINSETNIQTLVAALIRNETFIAALVNNEAFLDRLAGEGRVLEELAKRSGLAVEIEARDELATELRRRSVMLDALAARGQEAVLAVADAAARAAEDAAAAARSETAEADVTGEVGVVSSGRSALVALETAVELLEDSQQLLAAVESNSASSPAGGEGAQLLEREFEEMEAAVARAEASVSRTLEGTAAEPLPLIQDAVRELYGAETDGAALVSSVGASSSNLEQTGPAVASAADDVTIGRAYTDLVTAVAEMQRAYGSAISKAVGHAVAEVVEVEEAALVGAEKTKVLMSQKVEEVEKAVGINPNAPKPPPQLKAVPSPKPAPAPAVTSPAEASSAANVSEVSDPSTAAQGVKVAVVGAFLLWVWGTFIQPRSRYSR